MSDDLIELLLESELNMGHGAWATCKEAAAEILRLRAENEKLRDALVGIACNCEADGKDCYYGHVLGHCPHRQARAAAAALKETGDD